MEKRGSSGDPKVGFSSITLTCVQGMLSQKNLDLDSLVLKYKISVIRSRFLNCGAGIDLKAKWEGHVKLGPT